MLSTFCGKSHQHWSSIINHDKECSAEDLEKLKKLQSFVKKEKVMGSARAHELLKQNSLLKPKEG